MYRAAGHLGGAGARYRNIELATRVENASPHRLIAILFEELERTVDAVLVAMERGDLARQADRQARALSILQALDGSLDREKGGEIAGNLSAVYRECTRLIAIGTRQKQPELVQKAQATIAEIASAWSSIG